MVSSDDRSPLTISRLGFGAFGIADGYQKPQQSPRVDEIEKGGSGKRMAGTNSAN